jgi:O-methyltransferase
MVIELVDIADVADKEVVIVGAGGTGAFFIEVAQCDSRLRIRGVVDQTCRGKLGNHIIHSYEEATRTRLWDGAHALIASQSHDEIARILEGLGVADIVNGHPWAFARMFEALPLQGPGADSVPDVQRLLNTIGRLQRRHTAMNEARQRLEAAQSYDLSASDWNLLKGLRPLTATSLESLIATMRATQYIVDANIPGALVECGVFRGGQVALMLRVLVQNGITDRDVYAFDTFKGMPEPGKEDVVVQVTVSPESPRPGTPASEIWKTLRNADGSGSDWVNAPLSKVRALLETTGYPLDRVHFVEGLVEDTLPSHAPTSVALMRLDTDFYRSTKHELMCLYPRLSAGGIMFIDDYGAFTGSRQATDEYLRENGHILHLVRVDPTVRMALKPG